MGDRTASPYRAAIGNVILQFGTVRRLQRFVEPAGFFRFAANTTFARAANLVCGFRSS